MWRKWKKNLFLVMFLFMGIALTIKLLTTDLRSEEEESNVVYNSVPFEGTVNVWGKASIAEYFWSHLFEGELNSVKGYMMQRGRLKIDRVLLSFKTGPYLLPSTADQKVENLVIILNGREESKVAKAKQWLDMLLDVENFPRLKNLGIIILGNERCGNEWMNKYIKSKILKFVFIIYDVVKETKKILQWPLGVATYRNFPVINKNEIDVFKKRHYTCNFLGTVYPGSSRVLLKSLLEKRDFNCYSKTRFEWMPKENKDSMELYHKILRESDLTLCPVGINSESYRIYESMSYGSVPVLEDVVTPGSCDKKTGPYYLLKKYKAPVIYIKNWNELSDIIQKESTMTFKDIVSRRKKILEWYEVFKYKLKEEFLSIISERFEIS